MHIESTPIPGDTLRNMYHTCQNCHVFFYLVQHLIHNRKVAKMNRNFFIKIMDYWKKGLFSGPCSLKGPEKVLSSLIVDLVLFPYIPSGNYNFIFGFVSSYLSDSQGSSGGLRMATLFMVLSTSSDVISLIISFGGFSMPGYTSFRNSCPSL